MQKDGPVVQDRNRVPLHMIVYKVAKFTTRKRKAVRKNTPKNKWNGHGIYCSEADAKGRPRGTGYKSCTPPHDCFQSR